jgi:hypothetical protein
MNWMEAASACHTFGMQLAKFDSVAEQTHLVSALQENHGWTYFWLAGNDIEKEGTWKWAPEDTQIRINLAWGSGEPSNNGVLLDNDEGGPVEGDKPGPENCLGIRAKPLPLNDLRCDRKHHFICERVHEQE